jgi:hypothetical protein
VLSRRAALFALLFFTDLIVNRFSEAAVDSRVGGSLLFIYGVVPFHRGLLCHCPWSSDSSLCMATEAIQFSRGDYGRFRRRPFAAAFSCEPEVHFHTMAKKTVVLPRPSDTPVSAPIVAVDSRWILAVDKVRYAVDFHATARRLKQAPAKVVPIKSKLGSL